MERQGDVTRLLAGISGGDRAAWDELFPLVYDRLRVIARRELRRERDGHTLATTDVVHEAYFSLVGIEKINWSGRAHFLAVAGRAMRQVLVAYARTRGAQKRGGDQEREALDVDALPAQVPDDQVISLEDALSRLELRNPRYGQVVECRFFAGMSVDETAAALGVSAATVKRDWLVARAWLLRELSDEPLPG